MTVNLDILRHCMVSIGENPVSSYTSLHPTAIFCRQIIEGVNSEVQEKGWWFNKERSIELTYDNLGHVNLPTDTLDVVPLGSNRHLVQRDGMFYDPYEHTAVLNYNVTCDLTLLLPLEDLPKTASNYIKHRSAFEVFAAKDGDSRSVQAVRLENNMNRAQYRLDQQDLREKRTNSNLRYITRLLQSRRQYHTSTNPNYPGGRG